MAGINKAFYLFVYIVFFSGKLFGQDKHFIVYFKDKNNSPYSISNPSQYLSPKAIERRTRQHISITENDLPVNPDYLDSLVAKGAQIVYPLKWLNAAAIIADSMEMVNISTCSFVLGGNKLARLMTTHRLIHQKNQKSKAKKSSASYGSSYNQVNMLQADIMHQDGFHGEGILIALLDAGFKNAPSLSFTQHLFTNNRILATYDFVAGELNVYDDDPHGLEVLSVVGGYQQDALIGTAYNASFVLLRTEDTNSETETEEAYWARGAEYADSIGADILSSSLGYTTFDDATTNHTYSEFNGHTTIIARAADMAASKGMLVICSAGNEGSDSWQYITTPADGDSLLAIGAVDASSHYTYFSSTGPSSDGRIKPDLAAQGSDVTIGTPGGSITTASGTSFACPLTTGLAAGLWQAFPTLTNMQLYNALKLSASQYNRPDNFLGYGIPGYLKAKEYINDSIFNIGIDVRVFPNPIHEGGLVFTAGAEYFNQKVTIKMYDLLGRIVSESEVTVTAVRNEIPVNTATLRDGVYVLRFYFPDKVVKTRIVKN
ncbi:MAG TPA: S8 family serine peptidase [Cytophagaceae bacterium]|nr:S8 family serine peptidase [Cytophagaceae bacterium]